MCGREPILSTVMQTASAAQRALAMLCPSGSPITSGTHLQAPAQDIWTHQSSNPTSYMLPTVGRPQHKSRMLPFLLLTRWSYRPRSPRLRCVLSKVIIASECWSIVVVGNKQRPFVHGCTACFYGITTWACTDCIR